MMVLCTNQFQLVLFKITKIFCYNMLTSMNHFLFHFGLNFSPFRTIPPILICFAKFQLICEQNFFFSQGFLFIFIFFEKILLLLQGPNSGPRPNRYGILAQGARNNEFIESGLQSQALTKCILAKIGPCNNRE